MEPRENTMKNVSRVIMAAGMAAAVWMSAGTVFGREYDIKALHEGGIDPNTYMTSVAVGSSNTLVSWSALQGPFQVQASTNLGSTNWFNVSPLTNVLSGSWLVTNVGGGLALFRIASPELQYRGVGAGACQYCHQGIVGRWGQTAHADALQSLADMIPRQDTNTSCLACHTTGYGYPTGYPTNAANLGGVQCENCHGPAGSHAGKQFTPAVTLSALMCGGCHQAVNPENNHSIFRDWTNAAHSEVNEEFGATFLTNDLAASQGRMGACGFCHSGAVRLSLLKNAGALPSGATAFEIGQTCAVCHDPHDRHPENGGYHLRNPMSSTNAYNFATSQTGQPPYTNLPDAVTAAAANYSIVSNNFWKQYNPQVQICAQCHNARGAVYTSSSRPPHHSPQYNILVGNIGFVTGTPSPAGHATNCLKQCVDCHMDAVSLPGHTNVAEHSFEPSTNACAVCHTNVAPDVLISNTQTEISNRINGVVATLRQWALTAASDKLSSSKSNAWEYASPGTLSVTNGAPAPLSANQVYVPDDIQKARFNVYLVWHEGSLGIHNKSYDTNLLTTASNLVVGMMAASGTLSPAMSDWNPSSASVQPYDGPTNVTIRVQARDVNGKKMTTGGATVIITNVNGVGSLSGGSPATDTGTGIYYAVWTAPSDTNGNRAVFRATLNGSTVGQNLGAATQMVVTLVGPADASHSTISPSLATTNVNSKMTITVQARDSRDNNRITGTNSVILTASLGSLGATAYLKDGAFTNRWTAPSFTNGSPAVITATLDGAPVGTAVSKSNSVITIIP